MAKKAGMATGVEVARISVKVSPDTRKFRRELKSDLDAIENSVNPKVDVGADTKPFEREVREATTDLPNAKIKVDADVDRMRKKLDTLSLSFEKRVRGALDQVVNPETVRNMEKSLGKFDLGFDKQIETLKKEVRQARIDLQPDVLKGRFDTGGQGAELKRQIAEFDLALQRAKAANEAVTVAINPDLKEGRFVAARAKIAAIFAKPEKVEVDVDTDVSKTSGLLSKLASSGPGLGGANLRTVGIVAAVFSLAAPALALISGLLTTLPAVISAVLVPIGAIALGLDGIKEAASVLAPDLKSLKDVMSKRFKDVFTPIFQNLKKVFPVLEDALPSVANALGSVFSSFTDVLTSNEGLKNLRGVIQNIADTITASAPGIGKLTSGLLGIANGVTAKFPAVSRWFNTVGDSFDKWVAKVSAVDSSGSSPLDRAMGNLGGTLKGVLDIIGDLASAGFDFLQDPKFGQSMKDFVASVQTLIRDLLPELKSFFMEIADTVKGAVDAIHAFDNWKPPDWVPQGDNPEAPHDTSKNVGATDFFPGFKPDSIGAKVFESIRNAFKDGGFISDILNKDVLANPPSFTGITTAWNALISWLQTTWGQFTGYISQQWGVISTAGSQVWATISGAASAAWGVVTSTWGQVSTFISGIWNGVASTAQSAWNGVVSAVQGAWNGIVAAIQGGVSQAIQAVVNMGSQIIGAITSIDLASAGRALIQRFIDGISSMAGAVKAAASSVIGGVLNLIPHSPAKEGPFSGSGWTSLFTGGEALGNQFGNGLESGLTTTLQTAKDMAEKIRQAMQDGTDASLTGINSDDLKQSMAAIELEKKRLKVQKNALGDGDKEGKKALQNQIDQLQAQKDILGYQQDRVKAEGDFTSASGDDPFAKAAAGLSAAPVNFAKATGKQFLSDIGIGGEGAISKAITEGIQYIFQIGSVDEALSIKDRTESKQALAVVGR